MKYYPILKQLRVKLILISIIFLLTGCGCKQTESHCCSYRLVSFAGAIDTIGVWDAECIHGKHCTAYVQLDSNSKGYFYKNCK